MSTHFFRLVEKGVNMCNYLIITPTQFVLHHFRNTLFKTD